MILLMLIIYLFQNFLSYHSVLLIEKLIKISTQWFLFIFDYKFYNINVNILFIVAPIK